MSSAKITLLGLYNFDNHIFDGLTFPAGIDRQTAIDEILMRSGEFEIVYPDIAFLTAAIEHWGKKHFRTFEQWVRALAIEFDPLYNFDRFEEYTDEKASQGTQESTQNAKTNSVSQDADTDRANNLRQTAGEDSTTGNSVSGTGTTSATDETKQRQVSAYDESTYQNREKEITDNDSTGSGSGYAVNTSDGAHTETEAGSEEREHRRNAASQDETSAAGSSSTNALEQTKHTAHLYGNIGVTTSTQLLEDFLRVERFTIYEQIADIFVDEFCILIY